MKPAEPTPWFVKFWGTRGSIPTPGPKTQRYGGNTSCVELRIGQTLMVCDGGTGLRELGVDLLRRARGQPLTVHLFFSHPHWDHIQGFPFFGPAYTADHTLYIYGEDAKIHQMLSGQMQSAYFPVDFSALKARIEPVPFKKDAVEIDGVKVRAFPLKHPGRSLGFAFTHQGRKVVYATDNELDLLLKSTDQPRVNPSELRKMPEDLVAAVRDADLLIADGQYEDDEYARKVGWGHARASTAVDLGVQAQVKQLAIYHHDPMQSDRDVDQKVTACASRATRLGSEMKVFGAREGVEIKL